MKKIRNQFNFDPSKGKEKGGGLSQTVPNQTLSLNELLQRYTRGQVVPTFTPQYHDDDNEFFDNAMKMDKLEKLQLAKDIRQGIKDHQNKSVPALNANDRVSDHGSKGDEQVREAT